jgi:hypothetical protein
MCGSGMRRMKPVIRQGIRLQAGMGLGTPVAELNKEVDE